MWARCEGDSSSDMGCAPRTGGDVGSPAAARLWHFHGADAVPQRPFFARWHTSHRSCGALGERVYRFVPAWAQPTHSAGDLIDGSLSTRLRSSSAQTALSHTMGLGFGKLVSNRL